MGKSQDTGEGGIGGSLRNSLSKFTGRVSVKAPSAEEQNKTPASQPAKPSPIASTPQPMSAPEKKQSPSPPKPSSGPAPAPKKTTESTPKPTPAPAPVATPQSTTAPGQNVNKLGNDVSIEGNLRFTGRLIVNGRIKGEIKSEGALSVQSQAIIEAQIFVKTILVEGKIVGNIIATDSVRLGPTAVVIGDITTGNLAIEAQASFSGQARIGSPSAAPKQATSQPAGKPASTAPAPAKKTTSERVEGKMPAPPANTTPPQEPK